MANPMINRLKLCMLPRDTDLDGLPRGLVRFFRMFDKQRAGVHGRHYLPERIHEALAFF
ncbi:MAG TPA: hypothetical protein VKB96_09010 [Gammaproteobacteria bacterium]|nr:hypothetical protein [Gammaproteobacteria bacterium]